MTKFTKADLRKLWKPEPGSSGEDNGQVTIIGGSELFSGAPIFSLVAASRLVDMVFLATPAQDKEITDNVALTSKLRSVIWVPRIDIDMYIAKSDAVLIGPGLMRYRDSLPQGIYDDAGTETKSLTKYLLQKHPSRKWVIDGGSLQTMSPEWIPSGAILTPNKHEFEMLFGDMTPQEAAQKYNCTIIYKGPTTLVTNGNLSYEIDGGNAGLTKGGTGDVLAGIVVGLYAKNEAMLSACAASLIIKQTAEHLSDRVGTNFNADDVSEKVFEVYKLLTDVGQ